ncbi:hypothetical protein [Sulfuracidifex tepidarius]|uniref:Uncharacterized protein n=1 Tax=Sulfuracidifex tepidarius TaxID=1294262 RepID=A0A510E1N3_9CREN|nr:hypothetical protein [Sulfuracidifex tepidarius]BBG26409.1 hypothetical protein IC007_0917 [Sulfuracidifex tepidarius]
MNCLIYRKTGCSLQVVNRQEILMDFLSVPYDATMKRAINL